MDGAVDSSSPPPPPKSQVRIAKSAYRRSVLKQLSRIFAVVFVALFLVYLCFAASILRVVPGVNSAGLVPTKNLTVRGGMVPAGTAIIVNMKHAVGDSYLDRLGQGLVPTRDVAKVVVLAGPYGKLGWKNNVIKLNGRAVSPKFMYDPKQEYLNNEYIVSCTVGACSPGEHFIVSAKNIYGQPADAPAPKN